MNSKQLANRTARFTLDADLYPSAGPVIFEVCDVRGAGALASYSVRPAGSPESVNATHTGVFADEMIEVR